MCVKLNPVGNYPDPCQMWLLTALLTCDSACGSSNTDAIYFKNVFLGQNPQCCTSSLEAWYVCANRHFLVSPIFHGTAHSLHGGFLCAIVWSIHSLVRLLVGSCTWQQETEAWGIPTTSRNILSGWRTTCCRDGKGICTNTSLSNMGMLAVGSNIWMQWASIKFSTFKHISWHSLCTLLVICSLKSPKKTL